MPVEISTEKLLIYCIKYVVIVCRSNTSFKDQHRGAHRRDCYVARINRAGVSSQRLRKPASGAKHTHTQAFNK
jgi:hypothetical protein